MEKLVRFQSAGTTKRIPCHPIRVLFFADVMLGAVVGIVLTGWLAGFRGVGHELGKAGGIAYKVSTR
jgi:hypothetical protein